MEAVQRAVGQVGPGAVAALAGQGDVIGEVAGGGGAVPRRQLPGGDVGGHMQGVAAVDPDPLPLQIPQDKLHAVAALLAPLEAEDDPPGDLLFVVFEDLAGGQQHGGVGVMAAGVGHARHLRDGADLGLLHIVGGGMY